jgi:hypothetical protein
MRTERERSVLCTRARGEGLHHSAHRLNPRCICCCGSTEAGFLQALVAPAAVVDKSEERTRLASRTFLVSFISPAARSVSVLTLLIALLEPICICEPWEVGISGSPWV